MTGSGLTLVTDFQYYKQRRISEADAVAQFIFKLGDEGWELAAIGEPQRENTGLVASYQTLYFKRQKE